MAAQAKVTGSDLAPGPAPRDAYKPGDVVRLRTFSVPPDALGGGAQVTPITYVIAGVVRVEGLHASTLLYHLINSGSSFLADPANVIRVEPAAVAPDASAEPIRWAQSAGNIVQSACGRFRITLGAGNKYSARDAWTQEETGGLAVIQSAQQWCRVRREGHPLSWKPEGQHWRASWGNLAFRVLSAGVGRWFACDLRFGNGHLMRRSPQFGTAAEAQAWCGVRAACRASGDPLVNTVDLRFDTADEDEEPTSVPF